MFLAPRELQRITPETRTTSICCDAPASAYTPDDFTKLDPTNGDTMVMNLRYICNQCGMECHVHETPIE